MDAFEDVSVYGLYWNGLEVLVSAEMFTSGVTIS